MAGLPRPVPRCRGARPLGQGHAGAATGPTAAPPGAGRPRHRLPGCPAAAGSLGLEGQPLAL